MLGRFWLMLKASFLAISVFTSRAGQVFSLTNLFRQVITLNISCFYRNISNVFGHWRCSRVVLFFICIMAFVSWRNGANSWLYLGHSLIHRLGSFLTAKYSLAFLTNFHLGDDLVIRWRGTGGRTITNWLFNTTLGLLSLLPLIS